MFSIYRPPKLYNQFSFENHIREHLNEGEAIFIDGLDNWHLEKIVTMIDANPNIMKINFCSKYMGRLYCLANMFKINKLWFIDTEHKSGKSIKKTERIDGVEFLSVARV